MLVKLTAGAVENGDQCAWTYPASTLKFANNYYYNILVGGKKYLIQSNWNLKTKACSMA
jgi:hypothetical protein